MGSPASDRVARVRPYLRSCRLRPSPPLPGSHGLWQRLPNVFAAGMARPGWTMVVVRGRLSTRMLQGRPAWHSIRLGTSRFARHYYGTTFVSSGYMRWFSSPGSLPHCGSSSADDGVAPFGHRWITSCSRFPTAFRSDATSFIGTQRRGIPRALLLSSLQEPLQWCPLPPIGQQASRWATHNCAPPGRFNRHTRLVRYTGRAEAPPRDRHP